MVPDTLWAKSLGSTVLPSGRKYSHVFIKASNGKPYILFLHGFPQSSYLWRYQIEYFSERGYGVLAPDLLGYRDSDKPTELEAYRLKSMAADIIALLDSLGLDKVLAVGHDWGSIFLSRIANYYEDRFLCFAWLAIAYFPPLTGNFNVDEINTMSIKKVGYPFFGYWDFFNSADAADLLDHNSECYHHLLFCADPTLVKTDFAPPGAIQAWIKAGKTGPLPSYITLEEFKNHSNIFSASHGGSYGPPLRWYKAMMANVNSQDDAAIPEARRHVTKPTLMILCEKDYVAVPELQLEAAKPYIKDLRVKILDSAHWVQLQKRNEVNHFLEDFFNEVLT